MPLYSPHHECLLNCHNVPTPTDLLPEPLPADPLPLFGQWFAEARQRALQPNPDAVVVATTDDQGRPAARVVLCKRMDLAAGYVVFFTNYQSRKGRELDLRPRAAAVFHWDALSRQVRLEGPVIESPAAESDDYFASRPLLSRVGAWASQQTQPLTSRAQLERQVREVEQRFGIAPGLPAAAAAADSASRVPRPPHWGGYRLWIESIELWTEGANRVHDRARWSRPLQPRDDYTFTPGAWTGTRLNP